MTEKEKYLASAQKHVLKGNLDRAIKDYEQLVALDPQDLRHRQRLAELLVRVTRKDEAIREFETIGKFYSDNAYYLKSIAVYKQIQKLAPQNMAISLLLAELNEKQGLKGNALAEYQAVVLTQEKSGDYADAARVLDRMIALDPENIAIHLKLAEVNLLANFRDRAYREFLRTAILQNQFHDDAGFSHVCERVRDVFTERTNFFVDLAEEQMRNGKADEAALFLHALLESDDTNLAAWFLLAEAYDACGDWENVKDTYGRVTVLFPNDPTARDKYISCLIAEENVEAALTQLEACLTFFPVDQVASFEEFFLKIVQLTPFNLRPLLGLRDLYEKNGELDKLAEVEDKLELLRKSRAAEEKDEVEVKVEEEAEAEAEAGIAVATEDAVPVVMPATYGEVTAPEKTTADASVEVPFSWEEELDLALEDDLAAAGTEFGLESAESGEEEYGDSAVGSGEAAVDTDEAAASDEEPSVGGDDVYLLEEDSKTEPYPEDEALDDLFEAFSGDEPDDLVSGKVASEPEPAAPALKPSGKYSIDGQFSEFKKVVDSQIDREDTETHYNLGIAYKEMGLYRAALEEFRFAAHTPRRRADALLLQGVCYRESGEPERARELLLSVLEEGGLSMVESASIWYELALLAESEDNTEEACRFYREIQENLPDFRDVIARMTSLGCVMVECVDDMEEAELEEVTEE
jgi:tetratricopeptide (TPR) repeat protein